VDEEIMFKGLFKPKKSIHVHEVPATYNPALHYNCFIETVPARDRQAVYQALRQAGCIRFAYVLPDGRLQLAVMKIAESLQIYNTVATEKRLPVLLSKARLLELMVSSPEMEITALLNVHVPNQGHAERLRLAQIVVDSESEFRRGVEYHEQKRYQQAIECYDKAIRIEPEDVRAWHNKIGALAQLGKPQEALKVADEILALQGNVGILWEAKGNILADMGRLTEAGECMSKAVAINPIIARRHAQRIDTQADTWFQELMMECRSKGGNPETDIGFWWSKFATFANAGDADRMFMCLQMAAKIGPEYSIMSSGTGMTLLNPGHPLLSQGLLPQDAKVELLGDFFQRLAASAMKKKV
jgi:tetratricopeptide (TPR) repeat protein